MTNPLLWRDTDEITPPIQWQAVEEDERWWWDDSGGFSANPGPVIYIGDLPLPETLDFEWEVASASSGSSIQFVVYDDTLTPVDEITLVGAGQTGTGSLVITLSDYDFPGGWFAFGVAGVMADYFGRVAVLGPHIPEPSGEVSYNCECADDHDAETLGELRRRVIRRLGYSAQAENPPPGMAELVDDFLVGAQRQLYRRYDALRTERFYRWALESGVRFYDLQANEDECHVKLDPRKLTWVGVEDNQGVWYPLTQGIPPEFYTMSQEWVGWPSRYEIRQCIEIFPAPSSGMRYLRIKGHFGLQPFTEDDHKTTIDSELVFLHALAAAKKHYRQPDADDVFAQLSSMLGGIVAGSHHTARYIPGTRPAAPAVPPVFLPLIQGDD